MCTIITVITKMRQLYSAPDTYMDIMDTKLCGWTGVKWHQGEREDTCTYAAIEMLAADIGLTSFTSMAFWSAMLFLAASSCSSSS